MGIEIPDRVTKAWISQLTDDELMQAERQLVLDVQEAVRLAAQYEVRDPVTGSISWLDFGLHSRLCGRADTLRRRHDRICAEFVHRGFRDPSNLMPDGLRTKLPAMPTRPWLMRLSNAELLQIEPQSRKEIEMLRSTIAKLYRERRPQPDRNDQVKYARTEIFRHEVFCYFAWLELTQRQGVALKSGSGEPPGLAISPVPTQTDYAAGRAEHMLLDYLRRLGWYYHARLIDDLLTVLLNEPQPEESGQELRLRKLFRALAKLVHPDYAVSEADRVARNKVMSESNQAYENRDEARLRQILQVYEREISRCQ
jgi:hypothetical protein